MKWREMAEETNDSAKLRAQRSETAKFRTLFLFFVFVFVFVFVRFIVYVTKHKPTTTVTVCLCVNLTRLFHFPLSPFSLSHRTTQASTRFIS